MACYTQSHSIIKVILRTWTCESRRIKLPKHTHITAITSHPIGARQAAIHTCPTGRRIDYIIHAHPTSTQFRAHMPPSPHTTPTRHPIPTRQTTIMAFGTHRNARIIIPITTQTLSTSIRHPLISRITRRTIISLVARLTTIDTGRTEHIHTVVVVAGHAGT